MKEREQVGQVCKFSEFIPNALPCYKIVHKGFRLCSFHATEYLVAEKLSMDKNCLIITAPKLVRLFKYLRMIYLRIKTLILA